MELQKKSDFKYAKLYNAQEDCYRTCGGKNLVMGPETQKRFEENTDDCAVTICCITYNQEEYIAQTLDGFLMQKTNFKFKVLVGEDKGSDGTADIIREYAEKYPDIIFPFIREKNMGAQRNLIDLCNRANSPYIAFCEGDDYWTDEYKLQKQYDTMQADEEARICYSRVKIDAPEDWFLCKWFKQNENGEMIFPDCEPTYKFKDPVVSKDCIWVFPAQTATVFYRWNYDIKIPDWFYEGIIGDHPIFLMQLGEGKAKLLKDVTAVYRRSNVGVYMSGTLNEHFMKTRLDIVRWASGMLKWYRDNNIANYPKTDLENRIKHETYNFFGTALKEGQKDAVLQYFELYPDEFNLSMAAFLSFYKDSRLLVDTCTWEGYKYIVRDDKNREKLGQFVKSLREEDKRQAEHKVEEEKKEAELRAEALKNERKPSFIERLRKKLKGNC